MSFNSPLRRSKMISESLNKSPKDRVYDEQNEIIQLEIAEKRNFLSQSSLEHDRKLKEIRISYEVKLQQSKIESEQEIKLLQDKVWELKRFLDQEKQLELTKSHRFAISKMENAETLEKLQKKQKNLQKELSFIEKETNERHNFTINSLKTKYDKIAHETRIEKRRFEEVAAEQSYLLRQKLEQKQEKLQNSQKEVEKLKKNFEELSLVNEKKMTKIEKSLKNSQKKIENHEEKLNKVVSSEREKNIAEITSAIQEKEEFLNRLRKKNYSLQDSLQKLEKNVYGKSKDNVFI